VKFRDCYYSFENNILIFGNDYIERCIEIKDNLPVTTSLRNKQTGYEWNNKEIQVALFYNGLMAPSKHRISVEAYKQNNEGLSEEHLVIDLKLESMKASVLLRFSIFPETPFLSSKLYVKGKAGSNDVLDENVNSLDCDGIENSYVVEKDKNLQRRVYIPETDCIEAFGINEKHIKLQIIELIDRTDINDYLVKTNTLPLYRKKESRHSGNMFILDNYLSNEGLMLVKEGPSIFASLNRNREELYIKPENGVQIIGSGINYEQLDSNDYLPAYGCTIGVGETAKLRELYKMLYKKVYRGDKSRELFIMSNTWGDRNQDAAVCRDFIMKEIDSARELGVDIVQIDDGWQKGITANSKLVKGGVWEGYYANDPNFWDVNTDKFPDGLEPIVSYAAQYGIKIGLWFSPDSSKDFSNWKLDADTLLRFYRKLNIKYFKLDGIKIRSKQSEVNFSAFLNKVSVESGNEVTFNLDVTAEIRYGYLYEKQYGTIFVENRYTDWGNYYPHNTLKNLWQLSVVLPSRKFQFEVLNNKRNMDKYEDDLLAPYNYTMDYEFATVMMANPLIWMEMSGLSEEDRTVLAKIISVYKKERKNLFDAEIIPIGSIPDGMSFTGFQAKINDEEGYLLLFREYTSDSKYNFQVSELKGNNLKLEFLYGNYDQQYYGLENNISEDGMLSVSFSKQRSFAFIKYSAVNK
jgi:alpha-galactosidase